MAKTSSTSALEEKIADLQRRLQRTQFQMLSLCGELMASQVDAWLAVHTIEDFDDWIKWLGEEAVKAAWPTATRDLRARCPICGTSPFATHGFKLPLGLMRHVKGSHGQPQCVIAGAAKDLALAEVRERSDGKWRPLLRGEMFETKKPWADPDEVAEAELELTRPRSAEVIPLRRHPSADPL